MNGKHPGASYPQDGKHTPRLIAWELTRACVLSCKHCRAAATGAKPEGELTTKECFALLDNIASFARPIMVLTGGEPMLREDLYEIARYASDLGLPVALAPCGVLLNDTTAAKIAKSGVRIISISLDGARAETHDAFRGSEGLFDAAIRGAAAASRAGIPFQINTTVCKHNIHELPAIHDLAVSIGAVLFNPFLLVPTGRGKQLKDQQLSPQEYELTLEWLAKLQAAPAESRPIDIRVTCAPHYQRIVRQCGASAGDRGGGCLGGKSFAFISHRGKVQICGFLDLECGDVRRHDMDFKTIWQTSEIFEKIRAVDEYSGRCGYCEYRKVCGGCRARAYEINGDYLGEEPFCLYKPEKKVAPHGNPHSTAADNLDAADRQLLGAIQKALPIDERPYDALASSLGMPAEEIMQRLQSLDGRMIRRIGPIFNSSALGYKSTLVGACVPEGRIDEVAEIINSYNGVTHNYLRSHPKFNLWFTLTTRSDAEQENILNEIRVRTRIDDFYSMPAKTVYKICATFPLNGEETCDTHGTRQASGEAAVLDDQDKALIRLLQEGLPLERTPFAPAARKLGLSGSEVIGRVKEYIESGVIRRFGAILAHRAIGYKANAMCVFRMAPGQTDAAGALLARNSCVTHCYERTTPSEWPYELFAMVHGTSYDQLCKTVELLAKETGCEGYELLISKRELKKSPMRYFCEDMA